MTESKVKKSRAGDDVELMNLLKDKLNEEIGTLRKTRDNYESQLIDAKVRLEQANNSARTDEKKDKDKIKVEVEKVKAGLQDREFECDRRERAVAEREKTLITNEARMGVIDDRILQANKRISDAIKIEKKAKIMMDESIVAFSDSKALQDTEHELASQNKAKHKELVALQEEWMTKVGVLDAKEKQLDLQMTKFDVNKINNKKNKELVNV